MSWPWSEIFIARHGQTDWNVAGRRQGRLDSPLTEQGLVDATRVAELARPLGLDAIFTSPTGRAARTAEIIGAAVGLEPVPLDGLAEIDLGDFSGMTDEEIEQRTPGELAARAADKFNWRFPDGESYADADQRAGSQARSDRPPPRRAVRRPDLTVAVSISVTVLPWSGGRCTASGESTRRRGCRWR